MTGVVDDEEEEDLRPLGRGGLQKLGEGGFGGFGGHDVSPALWRLLRRWWRQERDEETHRGADS